MTTKLLIGLTGPARCGKSTAQRIIADRYGLARMNFADPLKDGVQAMFSLEERHIDGPDKERPLAWLGKSPRELLQIAGTEFVREMIGRDTWVKVAQQRLAILEDLEGAAFGGAVFSDVRFDEEADWIRAHGGVILRLYRPDLPQVRDHASEAGIRLHDSDISIPNIGSIGQLDARLSMEIEDIIARRTAA